MKKSICIVLILSLLFSLTACNSAATLDGRYILAGYEDSKASLTFSPDGMCYIVSYDGEDTMACKYSYNQKDHLVYITNSDDNTFVTLTISNDLKILSSEYHTFVLQK